MAGATPHFRRLTKLAGAAALLLVAESSAALAQFSCKVQPFRPCNGCTVPRRINVQKDVACQIFSSSETVILDVKTTVKPKHGVFGKANQALQAYMPAKGYVGADYFVFELIYEEYGKRASVTVQNYVNVTAEAPLF